MTRQHRTKARAESSKSKHNVRSADAELVRPPQLLADQTERLGGAALAGDHPTDCHPSILIHFAQLLGRQAAHEWLQQQEESGGAHVAITAEDGSYSEQ
jgi:hypothetical protein